MPLPTPTDDDSAVFVTELLRHQRRIYLFIASLMANPTDIEDVYQQTCLALWKKRDQLPEVRDLWFFENSIQRATLAGLSTMNGGEQVDE